MLLHAKNVAGTLEKL